MAATNTTKAAGESVSINTAKYQQPTKGTAGINSQVNGQPLTVSATAGATGGLAAGNLIEPDIDAELFAFKSDDTPLMQLMLAAKKVKVKSPVVQHYMIDEPRSFVTTTADIAATDNVQAVLPLASSEARIPRPYGTLLVKGVDGYDASGEKTPGKDLMLFVTGADPTNGQPIVRAVNGPKDQPQDEACKIPAIPAGTTLVLLSNALYETQKKVDPDIIVPQATEVYLQKRGMNQIVSDYFDSVRKRIPFSQAIQAEAAITNFKVRGNRSLYASRKAKFKVDTNEVGVQDIYTSEGVRYLVRKELMHKGKWTVDEIIALAKMVFTGEDVPKSVICLAGKNFLENIQCIDYKNHPEIQITADINKICGWAVTKFHTVFGDMEFKHDPTLDRLRWSNSAFIVAPDRLVHYEFAAEHASADRIDGEEATRKSILVWDALALKGSCHVWINGEGTDDNSSATAFIIHSAATAPAAPADGNVYLLTTDCPAINAAAVAGQMWQASVSGNTVTWKEYAGDIAAI